MDLITLALAKKYVNKKFAEAVSFGGFQIIDTLPIENISTTTVYLLKSKSATEGNVYEEYIYTNGKWESLGTTVDLAGYVTEENLQAAINEALQQAKANGDFKPVKGEDYWTDEDKQEIVNEVLDQMPEPEITTTGIVYHHIEADLPSSADHYITVNENASDLEAPLIMCAGGAIYASTDGLEWNRVQYTIGEPESYSLTTANDKYYFSIYQVHSGYDPAAGGYFPASVYALSYSKDGYTWTVQLIEENGTRVYGMASDMIATPEGIIIVVDSRTFLYGKFNDPDDLDQGIVWTRKTVELAEGQSIKKIIYDSNAHTGFAVGSGGLIIRITDFDTISLQEPIAGDIIDAIVLRDTEIDGESNDVDVYNFTFLTSDFDLYTLPFKQYYWMDRPEEAGLIHENLKSVCNFTPLSLCNKDNQLYIFGHDVDYRCYVYIKETQQTILVIDKDEYLSYNDFYIYPAYLPQKNRFIATLNTRKHGEGGIVYISDDEGLHWTPYHRWLEQEGNDITRDIIDLFAVYIQNNEITSDSESADLTDRIEQVEDSATWGEF